MTARDHTGNYYSLGDITFGITLGPHPDKTGRLNVFFLDADQPLAHGWSVDDIRKHGLIVIGLAALHAFNTELFTESTHCGRGKFNSPGT